MLKRINQHFFLIFAALFAVLSFFFLHRLTGDSAKVGDMASLILCTAFFGFCAIAGLLEGLERKLNKWMDAKTGGTSSGSVNAIAPYRQRSQRTEAEIVAAGLTAPRVTSEQIQALMEKLTWSYEQPEGTTSTFAHAYLGRFYVATGHSACVSPENFNAELGMKYAREQAEGKACGKLWELEGYALAKSLKNF